MEQGLEERRSRWAFASRENLNCKRAEQVTCCNIFPSPAQRAEVLRESLWWLTYGVGRGGRGPEPAVLGGTWGFSSISWLQPEHCRGAGGEQEPCWW